MRKTVSKLVMGKWVKVTHSYCPVKKIGLRNYEFESVRQACDSRQYNKFTPDDHPKFHHELFNLTDKLNVK